MPHEFNLYVNRDENSFTARLFEGILFPQWRDSKEEFNKFLDFLVKYTEKNEGIIKRRFSDSEITGWNKKKCINKFDSGMLFLELWDINYLWFSQKESMLSEYENLAKEQKNIKDILDKPDKTELDAVILCKGKNVKQHLFVFEVKCYYDLNVKEIERQKKWMQLYSKLFGFEFHHFVIVAFDYLNNAKKMFDKNNLGKMDDLFVLTWDDFDEEKYLTNKHLFPKDCLKLHKKIKKNHTASKRRNLINHNKFNQ